MAQENPLLNRECRNLEGSKPNARSLRRKQRDTSRRLAQIPFDDAQGRLSLRKKRSIRMTTKTNGLPAVPALTIMQCL